MGVSGCPLPLPTTTPPPVCNGTNWIVSVISGNDSSPDVSVSSNSSVTVISDFNQAPSGQLTVTVDSTNVTGAPIVVGGAMSFLFATAEALCRRGNTRWHAGARAAATAHRYSNCNSYHHCKVPLPFAFIINLILLVAFQRRCDGKFFFDPSEQPVCHLVRTTVSGQHIA